MLANDRDAAAAVHVDASAWGDALRRHCIAQRRHMIVDGTLKDPEKTLEMARELRANGYEIEVRVIGVTEAAAVQGVYGRHERARAAHRPARWVPEATVRAAHVGLPASVAALHEQGALDRILIFHRDPASPVDARGRLAVRNIHTTEYGPTAAKIPPPPHETLQRLHTRKLTGAEQVAYRLECKRICAAIARPRPQVCRTRKTCAQSRSHKPTAPRCPTPTPTGAKRPRPLSARRNPTCSSPHRNETTPGHPREPGPKTLGHSHERRPHKLAMPTTAEVAASIGIIGGVMTSAVATFGRILQRASTRRTRLMLSSPDIACTGPRCRQRPSQGTLRVPRWNGRRRARSRPRLMGRSVSTRGDTHHRNWND